MTSAVVVMMIIGFIFIFASFFISEKLMKKESDVNVDFLTVDENYEFSDRELKIIKRKIEDVIANQAKDILYETNESLSSMANEKTLALGDYAVAVCEEIEKNHKEVMFLYSMLDDKQKEIMNTVRTVNEERQETNRLLEEIKLFQTQGRPVSGLDGTMEDSLGIRTGKQMEGLLSMRQMEEEQKLSAQLEAIKGGNGETPSEPLKEEPVNEEEPEESEIPEEVPEAADEEDLFGEAAQDSRDIEELMEEFGDIENSNAIILAMHKNGSSILEIARQLGLGVGEVKLVIDLYRGAEE
ncbi:MAG: DUF6115 domain-containing protein [Bacteroidales bacterium]|nr:DUF6115 domain-containing protein [Clostridium sp.]MCM1202755.1 DUF6115 domain-containing protein [Bacteroidales bacterium]